METILQHAQGLVYSLLCLMPSGYQKASLKALLGLFLAAQGHALPEHTQAKSASSLSRFLNRYHWSTRRVIQTTRQAILEQIAHHIPHPRIPMRILIDLTTLEKTGKFWQLSTPTDDPNAPDPWVRILNGKRGLHLVVLYLVVGTWRVRAELSGLAGEGTSQSSPIGVQAASNRSQVLGQRTNCARASRYARLVPSSFSRPFASTPGGQSSVCEAIAPYKTVAASKTSTVMLNVVYRCISRTSTIPSPCPGFGSNEPMANENYDLSPPPILTLEPISFSWDASVGRSKAFSKPPSISLVCIVLAKAPS